MLLGDSTGVCGNKALTALLHILFSLLKKAEQKLVFFTDSPLTSAWPRDPAQLLLWLCPVGWLVLGCPAPLWIWVLVNSNNVFQWVMFLTFAGVPTNVTYLFQTSQEHPAYSPSIPQLQSLSDL